MTTTEQLYQYYKQHPVISTDTRKIAAGSLFVYQDAKRGVLINYPQKNALKF